MSVLRVTDLMAGYGKSTIVHGVSMSVSQSQVVALIGPNGAGKSTLLKTMAGLLKRTSGRIELCGEDVTRLRTEHLVRAGLSYVPQIRNVFPTLTVTENLQMGAYTRRSGLDEAMAGVFGMFPDLAKARRKEAGKLSGGQRTLLGLARALMLTPAVMLLDEPTAGVAPKYVDEVWASVAKIAARGTAVIVVEQNVDRALAHADYVHVLVSGLTRMSGTPGELAGTDLAAVFLGADSTQEKEEEARQ
jgi:branched-chain amino acid transport system ATP-binding protein